MLSFIFLQYLHKDIYVGSYSLTTPHLDTHTQTHTNTDIDKTMQQGERNKIMAKNEKNKTRTHNMCTNETWKYIHDMQ